MIQSGNRGRTEPLAASAKGFGTSSLFVDNDSIYTVEISDDD